MTDHAVHPSKIATALPITGRAALYLPTGSRRVLRSTCVTGARVAGTWLITDNEVSKQVRPMVLDPPGNLHFGLGSLNARDSIRLVRDGPNLAVLLNGRPQGVAFRGIPLKVFACVRLRGQVAAVRIVAQGPL